MLTWNLSAALASFGRFITHRPVSSWRSQSDSVYKFELKPKKNLTYFFLNKLLYRYVVIVSSVLPTIVFVLSTVNNLFQFKR